MNPVDLQSGTPLPTAIAAFAARPPSQNWEQIAAADNPHGFLWVWFKPQSAPFGLAVRVPDEAWQNPERAGQWSMRRVLQCVNVPHQAVAMWQLCGTTYDAMQGTSPLLDQPIPAPPPGTDPGIFIYVHAPQMPPHAMQPQPQFPQTMPQQPDVSPAASVPGNAREMFEHIEADWTAILETENEIKGLRKNLIDMTARLKTLNRDLNTDERAHADSMDQKDWLEARRTLRDAALRLAVCLKEVDMGDTSSAGQHAWYERLYKQYVVPRIPFDNMPQVQTDFSYHRKMLAVVQGTMSNALNHALNSGERRAQQVINRIQAKVRDAQSRKNFLGVMFDS